MKKLVTAIVLGGAFALAVVAGPAAAQIPVTVTTQVTDSPMTFAEFAANTSRWAQQVAQMKSQISQMENQYKAVTGSRNMGDLFNNPALRSYLPSDWQKVYDATRNGGYSGLSGRASQLYKDNKVYDLCVRFQPGDARKACEAASVKSFQDKAFAMDAYESASSRLDQITSLMQSINTTQDPKAIAELQGRIAAEQAMIANEQTKLQLYQMVAQAQDKVQEQRERELAAKELARRGHLDLKPLEFN